MGPVVFVVIASLLMIVGMYTISMVWYSFISKRRGTYGIEIFSFVISLVGIIILLTLANSLDMGNALASIFGAFFLVPVLISSIVSALLVKITITILNSKNQNR